jgi:hypothetical protein
LQYLRIELGRNGNVWYPGLLFDNIVEELVTDLATCPTKLIAIDICCHAGEETALDQNLKLEAQFIRQNSATLRFYRNNMGWRHGEKAVHSYLTAHLRCTKFAR